MGRTDDAVVLLDRLCLGGMVRLDPDLKIAVGYDGLWHGERQAFLSDRRRLNRLVAAGWIVLHVTAEDMRRPERLAAWSLPEPAAAAR